MRLFRFARDLKDLRGTYRDLAAEAARADHEASYKLTATARGFARRSRRVVDDKLSFSATLMRAGEVHAANRLLDEVQTEVRTEEAALMEQVAEVKVAQAVRREKMTRLRLVRMVAAAIAGSMLMGFSAVGMAAVSYLDARERDAQTTSREFPAIALAERDLQHKLTRRLIGGDRGRVAGLLMKLSIEELRTLAQLKDRGANPFELKKFLVANLPSPELAQKVTDTIVSAAGETPTIAAPRVVEDVVEKGVALVEKARKRTTEETKRPADESETEETTEEADETADEEAPADEEEPGDEEGRPSPLPPFNGSDSDKEGKDGDGGLLD
jgi:hypothetical protein